MTRHLPLVSALLLMTLAGPAAAQGTGATDTAGPPTRVARISYLAGNVSFEAAGDTGWSLATRNYPMTSGDRVYVDRGGRAELQVGAEAVRLDETADLTVTNLTDQFLQLGLTQGTIRLTVYKLEDGDSAEVDTPHGALIVQAPGEYRISLPAGDTTMVVAADRGTIEWTAGGVAQIVQGGQAILVSGVNPIQVANVSPPAVDPFDAWCADRDRKLAASPSAKYVSPYIPGYEDLDDAGTWAVSAAYGPVWYPTVVPVGWVPYRVGHWVWIEPWGWTWVDDEPWGYAPFHYGRWVYVGARWGWIPGPVVVRPYYAPALVVFVSGPTYGAQAWFPLGPAEPYHPWYHHDRDYLLQVNITNIRNVTDRRRYEDPANVTTIAYRNRGLAMTAVSNRVFAAGESVARRAIRLQPQQVAAARILPHPRALPAPASAIGGTPEPRPPVARRPVFFEARPPQRTVPVQPNQPLVVPRNVPAPQAQPAQKPPPPVLITRHPPPPQDLPFAQRRKAMQADSGRPLEPQQIKNLRAGRPAGPPRDQEYPPHPQAQPATRPAARPAAPPPSPPKGQPSQPKKGEPRRRPQPGSP